MRTRTAEPPAPAARPRRHRAAVALVAVAVAAVALRVWLLEPDARPEAVLVQAHLAANAGRYGDANRHLARVVLDEPGVDLAARWDQVTRGGTVSGIDVLAVTVRADGALVRDRTRFADGTTRTTTTRMLREHGRWREGFDVA